MREKHILEDFVGWTGRSYQKEELIKKVARHPRDWPAVL
jgi:hypothetical protein